MVNIYFLNFWPDFNIKDNFFIHFLSCNKIVDNINISDNNCDILFFSVFGDKSKIDAFNSKIKIFYTGENLLIFTDYYNFTNYDLQLGFDESRKNCVRFPYWLLHNYLLTEGDFNNFIKRIEDNYKKFCKNNKHQFGMICSNVGNDNIRPTLYNIINNKYELLSCGRILTNSQILNEKYGNNKKDFLKNCKYNICPENSIGNGYITEKIFDAFLSGCIPIYWGDINSEEIQLINNNKYIVYKNENQLIQDLNKPDGFYYDNNIFKDDIYVFGQKIYETVVQNMIQLLKDKNIN